MINEDKEDYYWTSIAILNINYLLLQLLFYLFVTHTIINNYNKEWCHLSCHPISTAAKIKGWSLILLFSSP